MPAPISFAQTSDNYPADNAEGAPILGPLQQFVSITFQVSGNCYYQLAKKTKAGAVTWDNVDLPAQAGSGGFSGRCFGIKFKSATSGVPVTVSAVAFFPDDAIPFQQIQAGSGGGGGGSIEVTDGSTTVNPASVLQIANGILLTNPGAGVAQIQAKRALFATFQGIGTPIALGIAGDVYFPFPANILGWWILANQTGSIVIDIWKNTYAAYPPSSLNTITGGTPPTITSSNKAQFSSLAGWTTAINQGDTLRFNVNSISTITRCTLILYLY